jgi:hypothetical protein
MEYHDVPGKQGGTTIMRTFSTSLIPGLLVLGLSAHTAGAQTSQRAVSGTGSAKSQVAGSSQAPAAKIKFRPYEMTDPQLGMPANRIAIPADWKANSLLVWNINAFYSPVRYHIRAEPPDGGSWVDIYSPEMFWWGDRMHDRGPFGIRDALGAIHQANISLPEALVRCVIVPNRRNVKNLRILGYRPVNNMAKAFSRVFTESVPQTVVGPARNCVARRAGSWSRSSY